MPKSLLHREVRDSSVVSSLDEGIRVDGDSIYTELLMSMLPSARHAEGEQ